ncbi:MAG: CarD family transcriptional regulator [Anaerolineales bacterium]
MFKEGDAVVHPTHGAGVIKSIKERTTPKGKTKKYYTIQLRAQMNTQVLIPVKQAKKIGLRRAIDEKDLAQVWQVLQSEPQSLPDENKARYQIIQDKLDSMDVLQVAEVVRDLVWRQEEEEKLKTRGRNLYRKGLRFLISEVAAAQGISLTDAEAQVRAHLRSE